MSGRITPIRVAGGLVVALIVTAVILLKIPSGRWVLLPNTATPLGSLVHVEGGKARQTAGSIYYVSVDERPVSELGWLFRWTNDHATYLPAKDFVPAGSTSNAEFEAELRQMQMSQKIAAAVAEREVHLPVVARPNGVLVDNIYFNAPAAAKVYVADVVVGANGVPTPTPAALHAVMTKVAPGAIVALRIRRGSKTVLERVKTIADPNHPNRALIGILVEQSAAIKLPVKVSIDLGEVGGPSAGLAFTLEAMRQLGANVTHGYKVAATGEITLDGKVTAIGGVEQKTWGVRDAGAQVFLVPVDGGNAKTAERFAGPDLKVIPVTSIGQALKALAALPKLK